MISHSGRYVLVFNGEIYNYREIRATLQMDGNAGQCEFRGSSDTEVMLAAFDRWGVQAAVPKFNGMFAFAAWDRETRALILARDRAGEKPLYYGWSGGVFLFGSELKALRAHPAFRGEISRDALALFMRHGYVPTPYSIYEGVRKLPPSATLVVRNGSQNGSLEPSYYWSAREVAESGCRNPLHVSDGEAIDRIESLISDSVRLRMIADVPLGAFLSGGIDSSTIVAMMQKHSSRPVKTFTIGFREPGYNEADHAKEVARHLGCDHTELYVTPSEAMDVVPQLPALYDEPFADSSQIPTYLVSKLARSAVTVSLSGDGGDEIFGGYTRYIWAEAIWRKTGWIPARSRRAIAKLIANIPSRSKDLILSAMIPFLPAHLRPTNPADKLQKLAEVLPADCPEALYYGLVSHWNHPTEVVLGATEMPTVLTTPDRWADVPDFSRQMMFLDITTYLPDDILVKLDRAGMAVSLESRVPLLDHRIVELVWQLPFNMRIREGQSKWLLRQVLYRYVPPRLIDRPKSGFGIPVDVWLRGPLRAWAEALLDPGRLHQEGFFNPDPIRRKWSEHLSGKHNWVFPLWNVLMFQAWLQEQHTQKPQANDRVSVSA